MFSLEYPLKIIYVQYSKICKSWKSETLLDPEFWIRTTYPMYQAMLVL